MAPIIARIELHLVGEWKRKRVGRVQRDESRDLGVRQARSTGVLAVRTAQRGRIELFRALLVTANDAIRDRIIGFSPVSVCVTRSPRRRGRAASAGFQGRAPSRF